MNLLQFATPEFETEADIAAQLALAILTGGPEAVFRFNTAGLLTPTRDDLRVVPFVAVAPDSGGFEPVQPIPISEFYDADKVRDDLLSLFTVTPPWLDRIWVWLLPPVLPLTAPGRAIAQSDSGSSGFRVTWNGRTGFLTAGHVARDVSIDVTSDDASRNPLGRVRASQVPDNSGATPSRDVATVEDHPDLSPPPAPGLQSVRDKRAMADKDIEMRTRRGPVPDWIRAFSPFYSSRAINGCYADVYQTGDGNSRPGDSGSAVLTSDDGSALGTVVAGTPGHVTLIQDIDCQLSGAGLPSLSLA